MKLQGRRLPDKRYVVMPGGLKRWVRRYGLGSFQFVFKSADGVQVMSHGTVDGEKFRFNSAEKEKAWLKSRKRVKTRRSYLLRGSTWSQDRYDAYNGGEIKNGKASIDSEGRVVRK